MMTLKVDPDLPPNRIKLPIPLSLSASAGELTLSIGMNSITACPEITVAGTLVVNALDLKMLGVPAGLTWRYHFDKDNSSLKLGPYLGIITTRSGKTTATRPFGPRTASFQELSELARKQGGLVAVFLAEELPNPGRYCRGYIYNQHWQETLLLLPRVLYNRIPTRREEAKWQELLAKLASQGHIIFNTRFINKPEVFGALSKSPLLSQYLPHTEPLNDETLGKFLAAGKSFFLKPTSNALGRGIFKVENSDHGWHLLYQTKKSLHRYHASTPPELQKRILHLTNHRSYLIQEAVPLAGNEGRVFDLRCLIQKDGAGEWKLVGIGARVSSPGLYLTHVPNGGEVWPIEKAFAWSIGSEKEPENLEAILIEAAMVLEQEIGIHLAILSADVGVNAEGHPYILELNSKPWRFDENWIRLASHQLLLNYTSYLEGINTSTGGN